MGVEIVLVLIGIGCGIALIVLWRERRND